MEMEVDSNNTSLNTSSSYNISYHSTPEGDFDEQGVKIPPKATLIKQIGPQHHDRLYSKILRAKEIENVVHHWYIEHRADKTRSLYQLYQLYVDLSAYQHVNIANFLEMQKNDINDLVTYLGNARNTILSYTGQYFLSIHNKVNLVRQSKIVQFIENFVAMCAKQKIMYDLNLFQKLITFFFQMSNSSKRNIKHTGVFIAIKHQTALIRLETKIVRKVISLQKLLETEEDPERRLEIQNKIGKIKNYDDEINKMISYIQLNVFSKNWNFMDPKLHYMRKECILELYKWIEISPSRHLHNENLNFIIGAMTDAHKVVRYTAIEVTGKLVQNFDRAVHSILEKLIGPISKQINDIDYNVSILAVDTITLIRRHINIPNNIRAVLCKNIYNKHYPLAAACGRYIVDCIKDKNGNNGDEGLLKLLMLFVGKTIRLGFKDMYPLVIEAIYDYFPVLQNVGVFISVLESERLEEQFIDIWINILTESVHITFIGMSSMARKSGVKKVNPDLVNSIFKELIQSLKLLKNYCQLEKLTPLLLLLKEKDNNLK